MKTLKATMVCALVGYACVQTQAEPYRDWDGMLPSTMTFARSGSGATYPFLKDIPEWSRINVADAGVISQNPALLTQFSDYKAKNALAYVSTRTSGGVFVPTQINQTASVTTGQIVATMDSSRFEEGQLTLGSRFIKKDVGLDVFYVERHLAFISGSTLRYLRAQDFGFQLAASGPLFDRADLGRLDMGTGVKLLVRRGNEYEVDVSSDIDVSDASSRRLAIAMGADYGFLYSLPEKWVGTSTPIDIGFTWKDIGTTQFYLGRKASTNRRFAPWPNNHTVGVGVGMPKLWGQMRNTIRLEYSYWFRQVSMLDKFAASYEVRLPQTANFVVSVRGTRVSGGLMVRFPAFEVEIASHVRLLGEAETTIASRMTSFELRSVF
jgi:hypothetical protein